MKRLERLPRLVRVGLAIMLTGGLLDVAYHAAAELLAPFPTVDRSAALAAHVVVLAGMVVVLTAVLERARQASRVRNPRAKETE